MDMRFVKLPWVWMDQNPLSDEVFICAGLVTPSGRKILAHSPHGLIVRVEEARFILATPLAIDACQRSVDASLVVAKMVGNHPMFNVGGMAYDAYRKCQFVLDLVASSEPKKEDDEDENSGRLDEPNNGEN